MKEPVGISSLYPGAPILQFVSMILLLILLPGFWKTRIFALIAVIGYLFLSILLLFIGMVQWRGNINDAPLWADLLTALSGIASNGELAAIACFSRLVWTRLRPTSARQFIENRRRNNRIDAFIIIGLPLLWYPTFLFSCSGRYFIIEDYGPARAIWIDWPGFVISEVPGCLACIAIATFNVLALLEYQRIKRAGVGCGHSQGDASTRSRKLLCLSFTNLLLAMLAIGWNIGNYLHEYPVDTWSEPNTVAQNIPYLQTPHFMTRFFLDVSNPSAIRLLVSAEISTPLLGFNLFAWFGFSAEARKSYREALSKLLHLIDIRPKGRAVTDIERDPPYWAKVLQSLRFNRNSNNAMTAMGTPIPFPCSMLSDSKASLPSSPARTKSRSSEILIDIKRAEGSPYRHMLSLHSAAGGSIAPEVQPISSALPLSSFLASPFILEPNTAENTGHRKAGRSDLPHAGRSIPVHLPAPPYFPCVAPAHLSSKITLAPFKRRL